jgi:HEPN domain-containing protein
MFQQAVEKTLKAYLEAKKNKVPKIHKYVVKKK